MRSHPNRDVRRVAAGLVPVLIAAVLVLGEGLDLTVRQQVWIAVWWALGLGFAFSAAPRAKPPGACLVVSAVLVATALFQLTAMLWGPSADSALADAARTLGYLGTLVLAWSFLGPTSWRAAALGIFVVAVAVSLYALLGRLAPELAGLSSAEVSLGTQRLFAPLGYWNAMAAWAGASLVMALAWSVGARQPWLRGVSLAMVPAAASVIYLTYSRGGVLATAIGIGVVVALARDHRRAIQNTLVAAASSAFCVVAIRSQDAIANGTGGEGGIEVGLSVVIAGGACWLLATRSRSPARKPVVRDKPRSRLPYVAFGFMLAGLVVVGIAAGSNGFGRGSDTAAFDDDDPSSRLTTAAGNRSAIWAEAVRGFVSAPVFGEGPGSFGYRWAQNGSSPELVQDAHSLPLETASELGLVGLIGLAALLGGLVASSVAGIKRSRHSGPAVGLAGAFVVFVVSCLFDWTWGSAELAALGLGAAGILSMAASSAYSRRSGAPSHRRPPSGTTRLILAGAALIFGAIQVPGVVAGELIGEAEEQLRLGDTREATDAAERALVAAPWSGEAQSVLARSQLAIGDLAAARRSAKDAISAEPEEADHRILLAEIEGEANDLPAVADALTKSVILSPFNARLGSEAVVRLGARLGRAGYEEEDLTAAPGGQ